MSRPIFPKHSLVSVIDCCRAVYFFRCMNEKSNIEINIDHLKIENEYNTSILPPVKPVTPRTYLISQPCIEKTTRISRWWVSITLMSFLTDLRQEQALKYPSIVLLNIYIK